MRPDVCLARVRALCRRLPATGEKLSWGHPNFTAGGCMFAALGDYGGKPCLGIATSLEEQAFLLQDDRFAIAPYVGKHGWVTVALDRAPAWSLLEDLLTKAHARILAKHAPRAVKRAAKPAATGRAKPTSRAPATAAAKSRRRQR